MFDASEMLSNIEFENEPPTVEQVPDDRMRRFCWYLTRAVEKYRAEQDAILARMLEQEKRDARNARRRELYRQKKEAERRKK